MRTLDPRAAPRMPTQDQDLRVPPMVQAPPAPVPQPPVQPFPQEQ